MHFTKTPVTRQFLGDYCKTGIIVVAAMNIHSLIFFIGQSLFNPYKSCLKLFNLPRRCWTKFQTSIPKPWCQRVLAKKIELNEVAKFINVGDSSHYMIKKKNYQNSAPRALTKLGNPVFHAIRAHNGKC